MVRMRADLAIAPALKAEWTAMGEGWVRYMKARRGLCRGAGDVEHSWLGRGSRRRAFRRGRFAGVQSLMVHSSVRLLGRSCRRLDRSGRR